ncbi:hypothetical protein AXK11_01880 [Cephaloticoccus primus]|uniref:Uncharacterized protein n=1 Tax=Cephaloticoccus primus TaxID=1548207 RepID=A0A139STY3_9BACT|nr:hypothetical protein AXK11_01880 [Cephaloticoccus primus]
MWREGERVYLAENSPLRARLRFEAAREEVRPASLRFVGQIVPDPQRLARVYAPFAGKVVAVHAGAGRAVEAGEPLVTLHSPELVAVWGEFRKARTALNLAERNWARQRDLFAHRAAAQRDLEEAQADLDDARSEFEAARERLVLWGVDPDSAATSSPREYPHLVVRAPQSGRVLELAVAVGEVLQDEAEELGTIADLSVVWLSVEVPEHELRRVLAQMGRAGAPYTVAAHVAAYPGETFRGEVLSLGELVSEETRTVSLRVALPNPDGRLKPGMFATVEIAGEPQRGLSVPASAVVQRGGQTLVYEKLAEGVLAARPVTLGVEAGERFFITGGLKAGAQILTQNGVLLP